MIAQLAPKMRPRPAQDRPQRRQDGPKKRQDRPKMSQERSKSGQEGSWNDFGVILRHFGATLGSKMCVFHYVFQYFWKIRVFASTSLPKASWDPKSANLGRQKWSRAPQERPRDPQEELKSAPERPKKDPRAAKSGPSVAQDRHESSPERPKTPKIGARLA